MINSSQRIIQQYQTPILWLSLTLWIAIIFISFIAPTQKADDGQLLMPLDDVYIHFQYARQLAQGQPYVYNDAQPPTSGATSFLYPFWLAFGYRLGFTSLNLSLWALIGGAGALTLTAFASWRYLAHLQLNTPERISALALILTTGSFLWHYLSGMETGVLIALMFLTLWAFTRHSPRLFAAFGILLALTRPEGSIMALIIVFIALITYRKNIIAYSLPIAALLIQPAINALITGTWVASGNQSKSILAMIPNDTSLIIERIFANLMGMVIELLTGYNPEAGWYTLPLMGLLGLIGVLMLLRNPQTRPLACIVLLWGIAVTLAVATLDNAFWHFKRYQMPLQALLMLHATLPLYAIFKYFNRLAMSVALIFLIVISTPLTLVPFIQYHALNTRYVYEQPYQMAQWLRDNTLASAVVAVHDVGMMRYYGERTTLDMVGLTTPQAASYWRNGVGSVGEFLISQRPDYIASYGVGHGYGLALFADTSLYDAALAIFTVTDWQPAANVALAAPTQGIYRPNWTTAQIPLNDDVLGIVNVANITSETTMNYTWNNTTRLQGFATEFHEFTRYNCHSDCTWMAGGRRINGEERFDLPTSILNDHIWLYTHLHPAYAGEIDIYLGDWLIDTQWIPAIPGQWFTLQTFIPLTRQLDGATIDYRLEQIHILPRINQAGEAYMPYYHQFVNAPAPIAPAPLADSPTFADGAFQFTDHTQNLHDDQLIIDLSWRVLMPPTGDYRFFVHITTERDQPPIAQTDTYLNGQPIGNWQVGEMQHQIVVDLEQIPDGIYEVAIGFYQPQTGERLPILATPNADADRLFIATLEIP